MGVPAVKDWAFEAILGSAELDEQIGDTHTELFKGGFALIFDGGGAAILAGTRLEIPYLPYDMTIVATTIKGMDVDSDYDSDFAITIDLLYASDEEAIPADTDTICNVSPPTLTDGDRYDLNSTLSGWTVDLAEGKALSAIVDSNTGHTKVALVVATTRTTE